MVFCKDEDVLGGYAGTRDGESGLSGGLWARSDESCKQSVRLGIMQCRFGISVVLMKIYLISSEFRYFFNEFLLMIIHLYHIVESLQNPMSSLNLLHYVAFSTIFPYSPSNSQLFHTHAVHLLLTIEQQHQIIVTRASLTKLPGSR